MSRHSVHPHDSRDGKKNSRNEGNTTDITAPAERTSSLTPVGPSSRERGESSSIRGDDSEVTAATAAAAEMVATGVLRRPSVSFVTDSGTDQEEKRRRHRTPTPYYEDPNAENEQSGAASSIGAAADDASTVADAPDDSLPNSADNLPADSLEDSSWRECESTGEDHPSRRTVRFEGKSTSLLQASVIRPEPVHMRLSNETDIDIGNAVNKD